MLLDDVLTPIFSFVQIVAEPFVIPVEIVSAGGFASRLNGGPGMNRLGTTP